MFLTEPSSRPLWPMTTSRVRRGLHLDRGPELAGDLGGHLVEGAPAEQVGFVDDDHVRAADTKMSLNGERRKRRQAELCGPGLDNGGLYATLAAPLCGSEGGVAEEGR